MPYQVPNVPDRLAIDSQDHIANRKPGFARFAASGTITRNYSSFDWNFSGWKRHPVRQYKLRSWTGPKKDLTTPVFAECLRRRRYALKAIQAVWQWPAGTRDS